MLAILLIYILPDYSKWLFIALVAVWFTGWLFVFKKAFHKVWFFLSLIILVVTIWGTLQITFVQNFLIGRVAVALSDKLHAKVRLQNINYHFFDKMDMTGLLVEDLQKDTLLYAGHARVNITDWFFLKNKATLKYVALDNAVVNMQRTDSVWNYQFLIDYFGGSKDSSTKRKGGIEFDIKIFQFTNIQFNQIDKWVGKNTKVAVKRMDLFADDVNFTKRQLNLNTLKLDAPVFTQEDYLGKRPDSLNIKKPKKIDPRPKLYKWNNEGWVINVQSITVNNGTFTNEVETERSAYPGRFDGQHLRFGNITGVMKNVQFQKDTLTAELLLGTQERSGFEVKKLQANFKFTPDKMEFNQLELITNKSRLGNYFAMRYEDFGKDMGHFLHDITLEGNFAESELNSDDLAFFAPELRSWKRTFSIKGLAKGTIDNLSAKGMLIKSGNSFVDGNLSMKGLPDINNTFIDFRANDLQTTYSDMAVIVPSIKNIDQPQLSKLGTIRYKGNFTGFVNDFVAFGSINTRLGIVTGDINMKLPANRPPVYLGKLSTVGFKLGEFLNDKNLGAITFNGKVNGSGFTEKDINANFDGHIRNLVFSGYEYQNINIKGDFGKKLFTGMVTIDDPNLKLDSLRGTIDLSGKEPQFAFNAMLAKADLKKLKYTLDDFVLNGRFDLNFKGSNIDNFLGTAKIYNASLTHKDVPLSFDSLVLQSSIDNNNRKYLTIHTNELDADLSGNFKILELPDAFKVFLSRYYPAYIKKPSYAVSDQNFSFLIKTKEADAYIQLLDKRLSGFNNSTISGNLNLKENELNVNADVPLFSYDGKVFNNIRLASRGNLDSLQANIDVDEIRITDSLRLPASKLLFTSHNDISDISIKTRASKTFGDAAVNARVQTLRDGVKIHFYPSSFIINDKKWELEKDGELTLSKSAISASEVKFIQGNQQVSISTEPSEIGNSHDVIVNLKDITVNDFVPFVLKNPRLEGQMTGTIRILDPFGKPFIEYDTKINEFRLDGDSIGVVNGVGTYSIASGIAKFKLDAESLANRFKIEGSYNTKDTTENQADISLVSERLNLSILNNYLGSIFTDIKGIANTADLKVRGNSKHLALTGTANITEGSMIVNYTQCRYQFTNETIIFNPDEIDFGTIILKDTLNNTATLSGKMYHRFFQQFYFDNVKFESDKLLVLNTTKKDNSQFYGKVIGQAEMTLNGPIDNMIMDISGEPSRSDTSHIYLLSGTTVESGVVDYIDFIQFGTRMEEFKGRLSTTILVNMVLTANPACKIDVILDETTGDIIKGEGNGLLKIRVGNKEPLTINGNYNITRGEYTFNFQTFLKKYFTVNSGSIVWTGDPLNARIDIQAEYLASKVNFKPLSLSTSGTELYQKEDVIVVAHLTETLLKPAIDFEFQLPASSPLKSDFVISKRLQQFKEDKNELNKQVTSLLLFNTFTSSTQGFITASSGYSVLSSTIGGVVSNALSGYFNKLLQKYVKNTALYLDLNSELESNVAKLQAAAKSGLVFTLLDGRLIISAGVNLDYNNPYVINTGRNNNLLVTPDITAEWILSKDGRIRLVGFNRTNYDLVSQRTRTGVSLSYRKDFDRLTQLFTPDEEKKRIKALNKIMQSE